MSRIKVRNRSRNKRRINNLRPLTGLLAAGLSLPGLAAAQSAAARSSIQPAPK
jgi:hypothetical protein